MKKASQALALLLAGAMITGTVAGCGSGQGKGDVNNTETPSSSANISTSTGETPLVVGYSPFSEKFSPFFADTQFDHDAADMTQIMLLTIDRTGAPVYNSIEGETIAYNGTDYTYKGISDIKVTQDEAANETTYNIKIRDDVKFSDGEPVNIDDVIFTMYALCDTDYDGSYSIYSVPIKGLENYRANSTAASDITDKEVNEVLEKMPEALTALIQENIVDPLLESEAVWAQDSWEDYAEAYEVGSAEELFALLYSKDESYSADGKDMDTIVADLKAQYGSDYVTLGENYGAEFTADAYEIAKTYLIDEKKAAGEGEEVPNITGIERVNDYEMNLITDGFDATTIYQLGFEVTPMHYYGDESLYDYENNSFGFTRGDLSIIREKTTKPMGAGPYKFIKYENKVIYYEANEDYYLGAPKTKYLQLKETQEADKISGVEQGTIDLTDPSGSKSAFEQISEFNPEGDLIGSKITTNLVDNLGYGYIGINAKTVSVGGVSDSDASKNLRKAFATIFSVYRDVSIDTYYGDAASVINYPISNTSWAAPQKSDSDYQVAYSVDVDGNPIYTDGMSADDKYAAAAEAALGYLEAAGYTVKDGKVTAAPSGAKLDYEIYIGADGKGDHPAFAVLTDAKAALGELGITLNINDPADPNEMWNALDAGTAEMWCAAWQATPDPDMYQVYHSTNVTGGTGTNSNRYMITDKDLDEQIMEARASADQSYRKALYKECLDIILDWGVEVPIYQRQNCVIMSTERINVETMTPDISSFYYWWYEIQNVEMN